jgi:hypothetical protein
MLMGKICAERKQGLRVDRRTTSKLFLSKLEVSMSNGSTWVRLVCFEQGNGQPDSIQCSKCV